MRLVCWFAWGAAWRGGPKKGEVRYDMSQPDITPEKAQQSLDVLCAELKRVTAGGEAG